LKDSKKLTPVGIIFGTHKPTQLIKMEDADNINKWEVAVLKRRTKVLKILA